MLVDYLVSEAIYEAGLQDRQLEASIDGGVQTDALNRLNLLFDTWRSRIPYASSYTFSSYLDLIGTQFVNVDTVNYVLSGQPVQYPLRKVDLNQWTLETSVINLKGLPMIYYFDPQYQTIKVYPNPIDVGAYSFIVWGRPAMGPLSLGQQLPPQIPSYMVDAFIYELAFRLSSTYGIPFSPEKEKLRQETFNNLKSQQVVAMSPRRNIVFKRRNSVGGYPWFYDLSGGAG
jgi:hypothetical protein